MTITPIRQTPKKTGLGISSTDPLEPTPSLRAAGGLSPPENNAVALSTPSAIKPFNMSYKEGKFQIQ